ncbi:MAG: FGGY family carbohydrate kinase, partial [Candidatus Omnitrophica bacterium]|nr:FGGY family carbohydrate kinase [Candidatus Omnitrophota bacterium]
MTIARFRATVRERPEIAKVCSGITTPAGWVTYNLCGQHVLGIGEASGMFPIDVATGDYRADLMEKFNALVADAGVKDIRALLPKPIKAGTFAGELNATWAAILGLEEGTPIGAPEGDQPAVLAGTYISAPGQGGGSWGTSICVNWVSDRPFEGIHRAIDHFCDPTGKPINMAWLKNGTTYANAVITLLQMARGDAKDDDTYAFVIPKAIEAPADCGGLRALPLMQTEPATGFV